MEFCGTKLRIPCSCKDRKWLPPCSGDTCDEVVHEYCGRRCFRVFTRAFDAGWEPIQVDFNYGKGWGYPSCKAICPDCLIKMKRKIK